jgi:hypothetical protein
MHARAAVVGRLSEVHAALLLLLLLLLLPLLLLHLLLLSNRLGMDRDSRAACGASCFQRAVLPAAHCECSSSSIYC